MFLIQFYNIYIYHIMGNQNSQKKDKSNPQDASEEDKDIMNMKFENVISYIAAKFITQANFKDYQNLHKPEYCNKLVILTSKVISHFLNDINIEYMAQRTKQGVEINKMANANVLYLDEDNLDRLDVSSHVKKKRMCIGIAKFYVKIAHLFAAIAMTINPRYTYTESGITKTVSFNERDKIPKGVKITTTYTNLCASRIQAIKPRQNTPNGIILKAKNCKMNEKINSFIDGVQVPIASTETKNLADEPGIPELQMLYYDDYNFTDGKYVGVSEEGMAVYMKDLEKFYTAFTGGELFPNKYGVIVENMSEENEKAIGDFFTRKVGPVVFVKKEGDLVYIKFKDPDDRTKVLKDIIGKTSYKSLREKYGIKKWDINSFSDIPLKDFHKQELCKDTKSPWLESYKGSPNDRLFKEYAEHIKNMIVKSQKHEKTLLTIIKQLFSFWFDPSKQEKVLTINPELNEKLLQTLVEQARDSILSLYINCEEDFQKGLVLFEGIIKSKMIETSQRRIKRFEKKADEMQEEAPQETPQQTNPQEVSQEAPQEANPQEAPMVNPQMAGRKKKRKSRKHKKKH